MGNHEKYNAMLIGNKNGDRAPTPLYLSILWPIIDPILVTFEQICNFYDSNVVTFYFYELTHFLNWMKNTLIFTYW